MSATTFLGKVFVKFLGKYLFEERMCVLRFFTKTEDKCQMSARTFLALKYSHFHFLIFSLSLSQEGVIFDKDGLASKIVLGKVFAKFL